VRFKADVGGVERQGAPLMHPEAAGGCEARERGCCGHPVTAESGERTTADGGRSSSFFVKRGKRQTQLVISKPDGGSDGNGKRQTAGGRR
jgi:hypothetical protein